MARKRPRTKKTFSSFALPKPIALLMTESKLMYSQHMVYFCDSEAKRWESIAEKLEILAKGKSNQETLAAPRAASTNPRNPPAQPAERDELDDAARRRLQERLGHALRGLIFIFAIGLPKIFYYIYGVYVVLVMSGVMERLQSVQFRQVLAGSRPSLDLQLARLRQRKEALEKVVQLEAAANSNETLDEEELNKQRALLDQFKPNGSWMSRFFYQLPLLFVYSAFPWCHPHPEYLT